MKFTKNCCLSLHNLLVLTTQTKDFCKMFKQFLYKDTESMKIRSSQKNRLIFFINAFNWKSWNTFGSYDFKFEWVMLLVLGIGKWQYWGYNTSQTNRCHLQSAFKRVTWFSDLLTPVKSMSGAQCLWNQAALIMHKKCWLQTQAPEIMWAFKMSQERAVPPCSLILIYNAILLREKKWDRRAGRKWEAW